jgi:hypothetical protein
VTDESERDAILLDFTDELVLVAHVDPDAVVLNGYALYRRSEVLRIEPLADSFVREALRLKGQDVKGVDAPLGSLMGFFGWAKGACPLVAITEGRTAPDQRFIGAVLSVREEAVTVRGVNSLAEWTEEWDHDFGDITRVDFLDNYTSALALVVRSGL